MSPDPPTGPAPTTDETDGSAAESFMTVDAFDVTVSDGPDSAVVTKDHSGPMGPLGRTTSEHAVAIAREVAWLEAADRAGIDGVVKPLGPETTTEGGPPSPQVRTVYAGGRTLRSHCPNESDSAAILAHLSRTIAALQSQHLVHGSVAPEHIIIRPDQTSLLCSPSSAPESDGDLVALGRCIEFATEQWASPSPRIEQWLLLAKRLRDGDETLSAERVAQRLDELGKPNNAATGLRPRGRIRKAVFAATTALIATISALGIARTGAATVSGPELEVDGLIVRVGQEGQIAIARPTDACGATMVYLLDPATSRIWTFDDLESGRSGTALAMVPGATNLEARVEDGCTRIVATGPAGAVTLDRSEELRRD